MYLPLVEAGRARSISSITAVKLATKSVAPKLVFPMASWTLPYLSVRYSTLPPLNSPTALPISVVTVPDLGLGINPRGPSTRPSLPTKGIMSGVAIARSKSVKPFSIRSARSAAPTRSAPASVASTAASPWANTATRTSPPVPDGNATVPRTIWSALRGSTPSPTAISTASSNLAAAISLTISIACAGS